MKEIEIIIREDGEIQMVHDDDAADLFRTDPQQTFRASHVEPLPNGGGWVADLRPVGGPALGPFVRRDEAIASEIGVLQMMLLQGKVEPRER